MPSLSGSPDSNGGLFDTIVEEYKSLRQEALSAREAQLSVLRFGVAILGVVAGVAVTEREDDVLSGILLGAVAPFIVLFTLEVWVAEVERSVRAGAFIASIERRVAKYFPDDSAPMGWENWLRRRRDWSQKSVVVVATTSEQNRASIGRGVWIILFLVTVYVICWIGGSRSLDEHASYDIIFWGGLGGLVLMVVRVLFVLRGMVKRDQPPPIEQAWPVGGWPEPPPRTD